jgi:hypothetical protein
MVPSKAPKDFLDGHARRKVTVGKVSKKSPKNVAQHSFVGLQSFTILLILIVFILIGALLRGKNVYISNLKIHMRYGKFK